MPFTYTRLSPVSFSTKPRFEKVLVAKTWNKSNEVIVSPSIAKSDLWDLKTSVTKAIDVVVILVH